MGIHDDCQIYLGCEQDARDKNFIQSQNIKHVLSIQSWEIQTKNVNQSNYNLSPGSRSPARIHDDCQIYLGCEQDARDKNFIQSQNIKHVLSIQSWEIQEKITGVQYHFVQANDNSEQDLKSKFESICNFLKQHENERVLVHCQAGISRSATACLAYLMKEKNMSLDS